jgi:hypothetical protein
MTPEEALKALGGADVGRQVDALGGTGRGGGTRKLAEAWAAASGKSVSSQMRAVQRALKTGHAPAKQAPKVAAAGAGKVVAEKLRKARIIRPGTVKVAYDSTDQGQRQIDQLNVTGELAADLGNVAALAEIGSWEEAGEALSAAVLDEYGGLGDDLDITDMDGLGID